MEGDFPPPFIGVVEDTHESPVAGRTNSIDEDDEDEELSIPPAQIAVPEEQGTRSQNLEEPADNGEISTENGTTPDPIEEGISTAESFSLDDINLQKIATTLENTDISEMSTASSFQPFSTEMPHTIADIAEDDEWGDFDSAPQQVLQVNPLKSEEHNANAAGDEDEWDDFGVPVSSNNCSTAKKETADDDEWGDFDQARPSTQFSKQESEDWSNSERAEAGNSFNEGGWEADFVSAPKEVEEEEAVFEPLEDIIEDSSMWNDGFGDDIDVADLVELRTRNITDLLDDEKLSCESVVTDSEKRMVRLWMSVRLVEEALSLKYEWKNSTNFRLHFHALGINPEIAKPIVPHSFDTSSILLPTPVATASSSSSNETTSSFAATTSSTSASLSAESSTRKTDTHESPSFPVVDFDWDTSGLTNPLKGASQQSAVLDVDFMSLNGPTSSFSNPLKKDLADFGLDSSPAVTTTSSVQPSILDSIMSKAGERKSSYRQSSVLSLDARALYDQLPDLQYLQANMLMFPMGGVGQQHLPQ